MSRPDGFTAEFYHTFKVELILTLFSLFHEIGREITLSKSFYEASITYILRQGHNKKIEL
jgi:hypothetical protein